jgi:L-threonylcarbamoyladenylate synthase
VGVESTVVELTGSHARLLRPGGTALEEIEATAGRVELAPHGDAESLGRLSPGRLPQHYAPRTPLVVRWQTCAATPSDIETKTPSPRVAAFPPRTGLIALTAPPDVDRFVMIEILSPTSDLREAAAGFFAALRRLDAAGLNLIVADPFPETGLGRALNDRLRRAAWGRAN